MFSINFTVGSADDARVAAEVCDFLADRMAPGAAPAKRTRASKTPAPTTDERTVGMAPELGAPFSAPASAVDTASAITSTTDPVALYTALAGALPAEAESMAEVVTPPVESVRQPRDDDTVVLDRAKIDAAIADAKAPTAVDRATRQQETREAVKAKGGVWFGEWLKANVPAGIKLSEFSDAQLDALNKAAVS